MNSPLPTIWLLLFKWTLLLALGWTAHTLLREKHSRWRLILWRSVLCFGLVLPLASLVPLPVFQIPICSAAADSPKTPEIFPATAAANPTPTVTANLNSPTKPVEASAVAKVAKASPFPSVASPIRWKSVLLWLWVSGAAFAGLRLVRLQIQLTRLRRSACAAESALEDQLRAVQKKLGLKRAVCLRVSDAVTSPFACGLWRPTIMLPTKMAAELPSDEISALLAHEIAHFRRHDLFWCVGWRWMQAVFWFHPLVWKIPAAHNLACEQEADRLAAGQSADRAGYPQLLARLALRVLALPEVETKLVLNGSSQIAQRLVHLKKEKAGEWRWHHSLAGFALVAMLFLVATGCEFSRRDSAAKFPSEIEFKKVLIVVQDADGRPIAGATIKPHGFRVQGVRRVDAHGWNPKPFGPPDKVTTDSEGRAWLNYPVVAIPEEKLLTGELIFMVSHPDYCSEDQQEFPVDGTGKPIRLKKGIVLEVAGHFGKERQPVTELVPNLGGVFVPIEDWHTSENGVYAFRQMPSGGHLLQLMGRLASGEIVFSDSVEFTAEPGKTNRLDLEMIPGIRIEGRVDDNVPRPVKNGRALIAVLPRQIPAYLVPEDVSEMEKRFGYFYFWRTYRPIAEDGTFVFESVPPGEVDVIVQGDGFVSKRIGQVRNRINGQLTENGPSIGIPQPFPLVSPLTKIEVITEPTATLELNAKTKWGQPVEGATVYLNPNVLRIGGIFGEMRISSEKPFRTLAPLPKLGYSGQTDRDGKVVLKNFPAVGHSFGIEHPQYVVPLKEPHGLPNRRVYTEFSPGMTNVITVTMQPVGKDFIGTAK